MAQNLSLPSPDESYVYGQNIDGREGRKAILNDFLRSSYSSTYLSVAIASRVSAGRYVFVYHESTMSS